MLRKINRLNEEIARWAFEIIFKTNKEWFIAFTNPTAGPWKTIKAEALKDKKIGEVYRFILEEDRPDIVMYNDELKVIIVFEAKDSLDKLTDKTQYIKSSDVVCKLDKYLSEKGSNPFWSGREGYSIITGLLWGSVDNFSTSIEKDSLFDLYQNIVNKDKLVNSNIIIGVETLYKNSDLKCYAYYKTYDGVSSTDLLGKKIIQSLIK